MELNLDNLQFELDDDARRALQHVMAQPGFDVLKKIQVAYAESLRDGALNLSLAGGHTPAAIAEAWDHARIAIRMLKAFEAGVQFELEVLKMRQNRPTPQELAAQRKRRFIQEAI